MHFHEREMPVHEAHPVPEMLEQHFHGGVSLAARRALEIPVFDDGNFRRNRSEDVIGVIDRDGERKRLGSLHRGLPLGRRGMILHSSPLLRILHPTLVLMRRRALERGGAQPAAVAATFLIKSLALTGFTRKSLAPWRMPQTRSDS